MRRRQGRRTHDEVGIRAVELRPDFETIVCLVEIINDIYMFTKYLNVYYIYDKTDTRVVHTRP